MRILSLSHSLVKHLAGAGRHAQLQALRSGPPDSARLDMALQFPRGPGQAGLSLRCSLIRNWTRSALPCRVAVRFRASAWKPAQQLCRPAAAA